MTDAHDTTPAATRVRGVAFTGVRLLTIVARLAKVNVIGLDDLPRLVARGVIRPIGHDDRGAPVYGREAVAPLVELAGKKAARRQEQARRRARREQLVTDNDERTRV